MLVNEELYNKVIEVRRVHDRVMSLAIVLEGDVVRVVCAYAPQSRKSMKEKQNVYEDLSRELTTHHTRELLIGMGYSYGHVGRNIYGFQVVHGGFGIDKRNQEGRVLLQFGDVKHLCIANTW